MDEKLIEQMRPVLDKIAENMPLSWYDYSHLRQVKEWLVDETLDMCGYNDTIEQVRANVEVAYKNIRDRITELAYIMYDDIATEVKCILEEIKEEEEGDDDGETDDE